MRTLLSALLLAAALPALAAPPGPEAFRRSYAAEARGDPAAALEALGPGGAADDGYVASLRRGWLLYLVGHHEESVESYRRAALAAPAAVEARLGEMLPLMALRRWRDAARVGEEVLALAPNDFTAVSRLAWIEFSQGQWGRAEALYRRALAAYPASAEMRSGLGWTLLREGRGREARREFEEVLAFAPDDASARGGLARVP